MVHDGPEGRVWLVTAGAERVNAQQTKITDKLAADMMELAGRIALEDNTDPTTRGLALAGDLRDDCFRSAAVAYLAAIDASTEADP